MAKSNIKLTGNPKKDISILLEECSNNNQISYHIKRSDWILNFLKEETGLDKKPMVLLYHFKEKIKEVPKCVCGKERKYHCYGYRPTCGSKKCINLVREESKKQYCLENYGVEYVTQLESMKEKSKQTCLEKYGVENSTKSNEIIQKRKKRNLIKYGVEEPISLSRIRGKTSTDAERGLEKIQRGLPEGFKILESDRFYYYKMMCPEGHEFEISKSVLYLRKKNKIEICNQCNEYVGSNGEQNLFEYISSIYNGSIYRSNRKLISPFEIDIVLEDIKLCIEFNGDYWHSINVKEDKYYHLMKLERCLSLGYDLIQIRENDWNNNEEEIKRKLFNKINNIYDKRDLNIEDDLLIFDLSWYDSRIIKGLDELLVERTDPNLVKVGQYFQWDCGLEFYKIR